MISRRKILSRSIGDICDFDESNVWLNKEKLFQEHIQEILEKWLHIDDEIWGKIIVMERNRRIAKAYVRSQVIIVDGFSNDFDGLRIGLNGFYNPVRDQETERIKQKMGEGFKMKMDDNGNILIKKVSDSHIIVHCSPPNIEDRSYAFQTSGKFLDVNKPVKLFDMKKFRQNIGREMRNSYPDRRNLENQCISVVAIGKSESDLLASPCWIMVINIVAVEMLKSKFPSIRKCYEHSSVIRRTMQDENPYSIVGSCSFQADNIEIDKKCETPPQLPPRDVACVKSSKFKDHSENKIAECNRFKTMFSSHFLKKKQQKNKDYEDAYYCGLMARQINAFPRDEVTRIEETSRDLHTLHDDSYRSYEQQLNRERKNSFPSSSHTYRKLSSPHRYAYTSSRSLYSLQRKT